MRATVVLTRQLEVVNRMFAGAVPAFGAAEWMARPVAGQNLVGFTCWHVATAQDWTLRTAIQGLPMIRTGARWAAHAGINPPLPPFGMSLEEADAVAAATTAADVVAYQNDVHGSLCAWLEGLRDEDLEQVPDLEKHCRTLPAHLVTAGYLAEVGDMQGWTVARFLSSPCIGHARAHLGELDLVRALLQSGRAAD